ncbi:unnamed protein product [Cuscuta epithymum]|uniref:L-2-hydroxyglutarate dehydrogenase, mitochondrial n=1 Tax=Cuscuta epithymum TaxID=186058 RepID=A0AAV0CR00_9ASTE|nr:unnamed protein product [Cuscuta epithymum]
MCEARGSRSIIFKSTSLALSTCTIMKRVNSTADGIFRFVKERSRSCRRSMEASISSSSGGEGYEWVRKERVDAVVVGAGVVGIAVARELAVKQGREVLVIDSAPTFGTGTSSRNSEVIHAGIYYPPHSLKARFCARGKELMYKYCKDHEIPHKEIGKLIVATGSSDIPKLNALLTRGMENGVDGLKMIEAHEARKFEPELQCVKALWSPTSGIVDTHSLMLSLVGCQPKPV